jgi:hypothetical protein
MTLKEAIFTILIGIVINLFNGLPPWIKWFYGMRHVVPKVYRVALPILNEILFPLYLFWVWAILKCHHPIGFTWALLGLLVFTRLFVGFGTPILLVFQVLYVKIAGPIPELPLSTHPKRDIALAAWSVVSAFIASWLAAYWMYIYR